MRRRVSLSAARLEGSLVSSHRSLACDRSTRAGRLCRLWWRSLAGTAPGIKRAAVFLRRSRGPEPGGKRCDCTFPRKREIDDRRAILEPPPCGSLLCSSEKGRQKARNQENCDRAPLTLDPAHPSSPLRGLARVRMARERPHTNRSVSDGPYGFDEAEVSSGTEGRRPGKTLSWSVRAPTEVKQGQNE